MRQPAVARADVEDRDVALGDPELVIQEGQLRDRVVVTEEAELTPERVRDEARGTDGMLQVLRADDREVEIAIWNTDGSMAEMSGNGTRIAGAWLMASGPFSRNCSMIWYSCAQAGSWVARTSNRQRRYSC